MPWPPGDCRRRGGGLEATRVRYCSSVIQSFKQKSPASGYTIGIVRGLQSIREIIAQLDDDARHANEWWQDIQARLVEELVPKKAPKSVKHKTRQRNDRRVGK